PTCHYILHHVTTKLLAILFEIRRMVLRDSFIRSGKQNVSLEQTGLIELLQFGQRRVEVLNGFVGRGGGEDLAQRVYLFCQTMTISLFGRKCFSELFLSPTGPSNSIRDPRECAVIFAAEQCAGVKVDLSVAFFVKRYIRGNVDVRMSDLGLCCFSPLDQTRARIPVVWLSNKCLDVTIARLVHFALLHERRCRITISSLYIGIDGDCFLIPDLSLRVILFLQVDVARKKRCVIKLWIEFKRLLIFLQRFVALALREGCFPFFHQLIGLRRRRIVCWIGPIFRQIVDQRIQTWLVKSQRLCFNK